MNNNLFGYNLDEKTLALLENDDNDNKILCAICNKKCNYRHYPNNIMEVYSYSCDEHNFEITEIFPFKSSAPPAAYLTICGKEIANAPQIYYIITNEKIYEEARKYYKLKAFL